MPAAGRGREEESRAQAPRREGDCELSQCGGEREKAEEDGDVEEEGCCWRRLLSSISPATAPSASVPHHTRLESSSRWRGGSESGCWPSSSTVQIPDPPNLKAEPLSGCWPSSISRAARHRPGVVVGPAGERHSSVRETLGERGRHRVGS